jgi:putative ABC transport system ATP-binding protein
LRRRDFGFVFQFGQLVPELSAVENAALPLLLDGRRRRDAHRIARHWLSVFDVEDLVNRRPGEMSGGQAQRVAVARAMALAPQIIFADEPTGSLDSHAGTTVMDALTSVVREQGVAVIIVTHEARVAAYADRLVTVRDGRVAVGGTR